MNTENSKTTRSLSRKHVAIATFALLGLALVCGSLPSFTSLSIKQTTVDESFVSHQSIAPVAPFSTTQAVA
jgi:hypothetical protein